MATAAAPERGSRGVTRRHRLRTAPDSSLSPLPNGTAANGTDGNGNMYRPSRAGASGNRNRAGGVGKGVMSGASGSDVGPPGDAPHEQPELLSRFIPADQWVGRVSLSSPHRSAGMLPAAVAATPGTLAKHSGGSGGASSAVSPNDTVVGSNSVHNGGGGGVLDGGGGVKGVVGLVNEGNWCYLNASLQVLARCAPFRAHLVECVPTPNVAGRPCPLAHAMSQLYSEMWSDDKVGGSGRQRTETPADVLRALVKGNRWFAGNGQHDAHEALRSILDLLHEELRRPVPLSFEPGHAALTAAMAASSAESAAADESASTAATAPATAALGNPQKFTQPATAATSTTAEKQKLKLGDKATLPSTPADGVWSASVGKGNEWSTRRVVSGDRATAQQRQRDAYWQSAAAETFQGVLLGRTTCRACGRHSDHPDRFYDLSVPLLAASSGSVSATSSAGSGSASAATAEAARGYRRHHDETPGGRGPGGITPMMESPRPEWEPSDGVAAEAAGGDRSSDWGGWRRTRGGWCSAARGDDDGQDHGIGRGGGGGDGGGAPGYLGGLVSSLGVWLGFKSVALEDCLDAFFSPERLRGANQYHCDGCGSKKDADKTTSLLHAPEILMLHVKRFRRGYLWSHKVYNRVVFPLHDLDVSRWLSDHAEESSINQRRASATGSGGDAHRKSSLRRGTYSPDVGNYGGGGGSTAAAAAAAAAESVAATFSPSSPAPVLYDLVGLVQHTGGLEHGHYTCFTRDDGSATWHHFNDNVTTKVSHETVASASPYILVYRRKRPSSSSPPGIPTQSVRPPGAATAAAAASFLSLVGIGPAAEEARDVRSRVDIMAREMSKAAAGGQRTPRSNPNVASSTAAAVGGIVGAEATAAAAGESQHRMSIGGGGGVSDTDGEGGGGGGGRASISRRRKGRGRRPGSESESEGSTGGASSWVYMSKAWALKWATSAYPGPVSNHHVVCRHGRIKPNVGVKRATKEMVAVPRGVHRSLVNRYGPRTPAMVATKTSQLDPNCVKAAAAVPGESSDRISVGRGRGYGMALVGSSRPLLELSSCSACAALEEEMALRKSAEQKEVAGLSKLGQERRRRRKAAQEARQRRRNPGSTPETDPRHVGSSSTSNVEGAAAVATASAKADSGTGEKARREPEEAQDQNQEQGSSETTGAAAVAISESGGGLSPVRGGDGGGGLDDKQQQLQQQLARERAGEEQDGPEEAEEGEEEEKWYLMAGTWLSRWHAYVLSGTGEDLDFPTPTPGPITNGDLVDEDLVPIPGKVAGKHYRGAMTEVWRYLHERYGGGPVICRSSPDGLYDKHPTARSN